MSSPIDYLIFQAYNKPKALALASVEHQLTFQDLLVLVKKAANKFRMAGVLPGQLAITILPTKFMDWIATLALMHEGLTTCACFADNPIEVMPYDWVITSESITGVSPEKQITLDAAWLSDLNSQSFFIGQKPLPAPDTPFRLVFTSGTPGQNKIVAYTQRQVINRAKDYILAIKHADSLIQLMAQFTSGGIIDGVSHLITGTPLFCSTNNASTIELIKRFSIKSLFGSPMHLTHLIHDLSEQKQSLPSLSEVYYAGGKITKTQLEKIKTNLSPNITNMYGSTEAGFSTSCRPLMTPNLAVVGRPHPETQLQIVNNDDQPLPAGQPGQIRVKSSTIVSGYYYPEEVGDDCFKGGWFYPGDMGKILPDGAVELLGRTNE